VPYAGTFVPLRRFSRLHSEAGLMMTMTNFQPLVALLAGILILIIPRLLN
jgi:DUF3096 family protein